jgi:hypothetical protein
MSRKLHIIRNLDNKLKWFVGLMLLLHFPWGKEPQYPLYRMLGLPRDMLVKRWFSTSAGNRTPFVRRIASHYNVLTELCQLFRGKCNLNDVSKLVSCFQETCHICVTNI